MNPLQSVQVGLGYMKLAQVEASWMVGWPSISGAPSTVCGIEGGGGEGGGGEGEGGGGEGEGGGGEGGGGEGGGGDGEGGLGGTGQAVWQTYFLLVAQDRSSHLPRLLTSRQLNCKQFPE